MSCVYSKRHIEAEKTLYEQLLQEHQQQQQKLYQIVLIDEEPVPVESDFTAQQTTSVADMRKVNI